MAEPLLVSSNSVTHSRYGGARTGNSSHSVTHPLYSGARTGSSSHSVTHPLYSGARTGNSSHSVTHPLYSGAKVEACPCRRFGFIEGGTLDVSKIGVLAVINQLPVSQTMYIYLIQTLTISCVLIQIMLF